MKATLQFDLPEESQDHLDALNGTTWKVVVYSIDARVRNLQKHGHNLASIEDALETFRDVIQNEINDKGLTL